MSNILIREASDNDIHVILGLLYNLGRPKPQKDSDVDEFRMMVQKYMTQPDKKIVVAELDDVEIIGVASIMFLPRLNHTTYEMYIPELIVLEKYRNQHVGKRLIDYCIALANAKKCHRIRLESGHRRNDAHQFYLHLGFEQSALSFSKNI